MNTFSSPRFWRSTSVVLVTLLLSPAAFAKHHFDGLIELAIGVVLTIILIGALCKYAYLKYSKTPFKLSKIIILAGIDLLLWFVLMSAALVSPYELPTVRWHLYLYFIALVSALFIAAVLLHAKILHINIPRSIITATSTAAIATLLFGTWLFEWF